MNPSPASLVAPVRNNHADERLARLNRFLARQWQHNAFLIEHWKRAGLRAETLTALSDLSRYPILRRADIQQDRKRNSPVGTNLTVAGTALVRWLQSSGTTGDAVRWGDTTESWARVVNAGRDLFRLSGVSGADHVALAMPTGDASGPAIMEAGARALGAAVLRVGNEPSPGTWQALSDFRPTVLAGRPTRLAAWGQWLAAWKAQPDQMGVTRLILTGAHAEPEIRRQLERRWNARCYDRYGCTEAGSLAAECEAHPGGMHLLEDWFVVESIRPGTDFPAAPGDPGELVVTSLLREAMPIVRYATGDLVSLCRDHTCACGRFGTLLLGGVRRIGSAE